jgi:GNAT superfamily N-acetyltransferase
MTDFNTGHRLRTGVPTIRAATDRDIDQITDVMVAAFLDTPDGPWLVPDRDERRAVYERYCKALTGFTLADDNGYVEVADIDGQIAGAAIWLDYVHVSVAAADWEAQWPPLAANACGDHMPRFLLLDTVFAAHHPTTPHFYLAWLGVHPDRHRTGLGAALLRHRHTDLDDLGVPAYLVATSYPARNLFLRHGYQDHQPAPFFLPDNGPAMWPMWRDPGTTPSAGSWASGGCA